MPPKPAQAGKFKPVKRPPKPAAKPAAAPADSSNRGKSPRRERGDGRGRDGRTSGRQDGRGRGGRDGRGRGRGRFVAPTGATFFTGASTKQPDEVASSQQPTATTIAAGQDGAVVLPFTKPFSNDGDRSSGSGVARTAAESMAAAARARLGEGEEIIVAELDMIDEPEPKKVSVLEQPSRRDGLPSLFEEENVDEMPMGVDSNYVYDSDSSEEERRREKKKDVRESGIKPLQLPFPLASHQTPTYACQEDIEEKKDGIENIVSSMAGSQLTTDAEERSPFLDWSSPQIREDMKFAERSSWFLMKFPTRLPHLDGGSLSGGVTTQNNQQSVPIGGVAVKSENAEGLEVVDGNTEVGDTANSTTAWGGDTGHVGGSAGPVGYDNTLKDILPGKYGKILVHKSGRTELVVGGHNGDPEVRHFSSFKTNSRLL